jgi:hypothetical protein
MDGQTERVNQILEDMLRACVMENHGSWDKNLPGVEFSYNNSYQESLKMAPFEALYGCRCCTLHNWIEPGEKVIFGPDLIDEAKATVHRIQENLKAARSHQRSYANKRCLPLEFEVWGHIYLRVSPMKGVKRFRRKVNTSLHQTFSHTWEMWTCGIQIGVTAILAGLHDIFHVSQLKKCLKAPVDVVLPEVTPLEADLTYPKHPIKVLDQKDRVTRRKTIKFFKVQ